MPAQTSADRGRQVRQRLLAAAASLIPELGWGAVSTRAVAERAGVGPGLVHYHFASLPALLREAAVGAMREILAAARPMPGSGDVHRGLDGLLGSLDRYTGTDPASLLFVEAYLAATRDEELHRELSAIITEFGSWLARWLADHGQELPEQTAAVLAAAIDGVVLHRALNPVLTSAAVAPVLRRLLTAGSTPSDVDREGR